MEKPTRYTLIIFGPRRYKDASDGEFNQNIPLFTRTFDTPLPAFHKGDFLNLTGFITDIQVDCKEFAIKYIWHTLIETEDQFCFQTIIDTMDIGDYTDW